MPHNKVAFDFFESNVIPLLQKAGCKSMLYVGWRHDCKPWWHDYMAKQLGGPLGVLEIFPKNISDLEHAVWNGRYQVDSVIAGDARDPGSALVKGFWDVIFWDHGPEHVTWEELKECTPKLLDYAGKALVYCCPWGSWPQGEEDGNPNEVHRNYVTKDHIFELGMTLKTFFDPGQENAGELVALVGK
jgi:hypothetical protein